MFSHELCTLYILLCSTQPILVVVLLDGAVLASGTHTLVHWIEWWWSAPNVLYIIHCAHTLLVHWIVVVVVQIIHSAVYTVAPDSSGGGGGLLQMYYTIYVVHTHWCTG